ncbi:MAG: T9SS type A sorting domain-containing protein, partial [Bacteroidota bacterium]
EAECADYSTISPESPTEVDAFYDTYLALLLEWGNRMDGGDKEGLLDRVSTTPRAQYGPVKTELANISPFVSAEVIVAAFDRSDVFSNSDLQNLITANPEALKEQVLKDEVNTRWGSQTLSMMEQSMAAQTMNSPSSRAQLETALYEEARASMPLINRGIQMMYQDSTLLDYTPLRAALAPKTDFNVALQYTETFWHEGQIEKYLEAAQALSLAFPEETDVTDYETFASSLSTHILSGESLLKLSETEIQSLVTLGANCDNELIRKKIGQFLWAYFQIELPPTIQAIEDVTSSPTPMPTVRATDRTTKLHPLNLYPNPVGAGQELQVIVPHAADWTYVLSSLEQKVVATGRWDNVASQTPVNINLPQVAPGVYFLQLFSGQYTTQAKIIIQ